MKPPGQTWVGWTWVGWTIINTRLTLHLSWFIILPAGMWTIATVYLPIMLNLTNRRDVWLITGLIAFLAAVSLLVHGLAHLLAARLVRRAVSASPPVLTLLVFGDAAQAWPAANSAWQETGIAAAGPLANLLLAGLAYLAWTAPLPNALNITALLISLFNLWLTLINLVPAFPFDGGRLSRVIVQSWLGRPGAATPAAVRLGYLVAAVLLGWGIFLVAQQFQFSYQTGGVTIFFALLLIAGLVRPRAWEGQPATQVGNPGRVQPLRILSAGLVILGLSAVSSALLLTNDGIEAPGAALSVEPMVEVPAQYRHQPAGTFILTSVLSQTPIPVAAWLATKLDPALALLPPAKLAPNQPTPQENARQGFQMLDTSEITAIVVGLRLAGYTAQEVGQGASVVSLLPDSPSQGILQAGDIITAVNGKPIQTTSDLINQIQAQDPLSKVSLQVTRSGKQLQLSVGLMPPAAPGAAPKIGITIDSAGFNYKLPFPVTITPQKIVGGPSAGLMFTLTVYNALSPVDLTHGLKIAGTGTINPDGTVGPIGGVQQKVAAAEAAGQSISFLQWIITKMRSRLLTTSRWSKWRM